MARRRGAGARVGTVVGTAVDAAVAGRGRRRRDEAAGRATEKGGPRRPQGRRRRRAGRRERRQGRGTDDPRPGPPHDRRSARSFCPCSRRTRWPRRGRPRPVGRLPRRPARRHPRPAQRLLGPRRRAARPDRPAREPPRRPRRRHRGPRHHRRAPVRPRVPAPAGGPARSPSAPPSRCRRSAARPRTGRSPHELDRDRADPAGPPLGSVERSDSEAAGGHRGGASSGASERHRSAGRHTTYRPPLEGRHPARFGGREPV